MICGLVYGCSQWMVNWLSYLLTAWCVDGLTAGLVYWLLSMTDWLICGLTDNWFIDVSSDWLADWRWVDEMMGCCNDGLTDWCSDVLIGWCTGGLFWIMDWLNYVLIDRRIDLLIA